MKGQKICERCGSVGYPTTYTHGSTAVEIALWLLLLIPGIIYSVWRQATAFKACPECGGDMLDLNTPRGRKLLGEYHSTQSVAEMTKPAPSESYGSAVFGAVKIAMAITLVVIAILFVFVALASLKK